RRGAAGARRPPFEGQRVGAGVGGDGRARFVLGGDREVVGGARVRGRGGDGEDEVGGRADRDFRFDRGAGRRPGPVFGEDLVGVGAWFEAGVDAAGVVVFRFGGARARPAGRAPVAGPPVAATGGRRAFRPGERHRPAHRRFGRGDRRHRQRGDP